MKRTFLPAILSIALVTAFAQNKMRSLNELIDLEDPAWPLVHSWIDSAKNKVRVLPANPAQSKEALHQVQVTTRSPMGAVIYSTGGLLIDDGWIRILGSGHTGLTRTVPQWNLGKSFTSFGERPPFLLVADDAVGGFFALNGGEFGEDIGKIYYLSPDNLEWEPLDLSYSEFLMFCFNGDLAGFYSNLRWKGWREEVLKLHGDSVFNFFPTLWSKEGKNIETNSRKMVPVQEQYELHLAFRKQSGLDD